MSAVRYASSGGAAAAAWLHFALPLPSHLGQVRPKTRPEPLH